MEKYSFLLSVYYKDVPEYLSCALDSMLSQTYLPDEIVVVKDGAVGENLQRVIDEYLNKGIPIVQVQLPENVGLGLALNEGIRAARNELIARMDADDICFPERCELEAKEFDKDPSLCIVGGHVLEFDGTTSNIVGMRKVPCSNKSIYCFAKTRDPFNHPAVMYRKSVIEAVGGYSNYRKNQDTDLWIKLLLNNVVCKNIDKPVLYFRFDKDTGSRRKKWSNIKILLEIRFRAWRSGFCSFGDLVFVFVEQIAKFIMPIGLQRLIRRIW